MISVNINLNKIDQTKVKNHSNGAAYCDLILIDRKDDYGNDYMVVQGLSKEDRAAGVKGAILGNAKNFASTGFQERPKTTRKPETDELTPF
jgi:hypothetical protein